MSRTRTATEKLEDKIFRDMSMLAVERCRDAFRSVDQLIHDQRDAMRSALAINVAMDMIQGAAFLLRKDAEFAYLKNDEEAARYIITQICQEMLPTFTAQMSQKPAAKAKPSRH